MILGERLDVIASRFFLRLRLAERQRCPIPPLQSPQDRPSSLAQFLIVPLQH